ncbi:MAG: SMC-Scp complex subunit ScpB [Chloroflexi bacterium]|nr:SMC-Scp complex subunit ScpB [Chloroflexota bacterium]
MKPDPAGDLVLRSVPEPWPFPSQLRVVAELVAAVDLADGPKAALQVLAIVAYEQPVSRADVAHIRGPDSAGVIDTTARLQADRRRCPLWPHSAYTVVTVWAAASSRWP